jgi:hypothetical protein
MMATMPAAGASGPASFAAGSRFPTRGASLQSHWDEDGAPRASFDTIGAESAHTMSTGSSTSSHSTIVDGSRSGAGGSSIASTSRIMLEQQQRSAGMAASGFASPMERDEAEYDGSDDGPGMAAEEYVVALHDFTSSNSTCLSFAAGQVIKVFNRDMSGWWDGELNGQRGWFPSNYIDEEALPFGSPEGGASMQLSSSDQGQSYDRDAEATPQPSFQGAGRGLGLNGTLRPRSRGTEHRHLAPQAQHALQHRQMSYPSRSPTPTEADFLERRGSAGILDPILHAIALLHNAVRANRFAHFQPSTACVISSVRSVLSATDCLTRESPVLKAHPVLARERKQILAELSRLVTQARKASAPVAEDAGRDADMDAMLGMADGVLRHVRRFLEVAVECGVNVPDRRSSVYDDLYADGRQGSQARQPGGAVAPPDRSEQDKTPTPDSPRSSAYLTAYTSGQLSPRSARFAAQGGRPSAAAEEQARQAQQTSANGEPSPAARIKAQAEARGRSDSLVSEPQEGGGGSGSASGSGSDSMVGSRSGSCESLEVPAAAAASICSPQEVLQRLSAANDQLLSITAAFIGHVHTHTRDSHASSYAHLIDMTREAVDGVRSLLLVVEAVNNSAELQAAFPRQTAILWETREGLYEATTALVTAARVITSAPANASSPSMAGINEDDEKSRLLHAATAVLRTGGECVGAVRLCLNRADSTLRLTLAGSAKHNAARAQQSEAETEALADAMEEDLSMSEAGESGTGARRGKHTLSFLGRKASSLSCLREKYEQNGSAAPDLDVMDEQNEEEEAIASSIDSRQEPLRAYDAASSADDMPKSALLERRGVRRPQPLLGNARRPSNPPPLSANAALSRPPRNMERHAPTASADSNSGDASDSSEPMSRDHSRTSGSTLNSGRSDTTADTSARPSMDRSEHDAFPFDDVHAAKLGPLSAPVVRDTPKGLLLASLSEPSARRGSDASEASTRGRNGSVPDSAGFALSPLSAGSTSSSMPPSLLEARLMAPDFDPSDVAYNSEGQVTGATLAALVEKMTPHDTTVDATFSNAFFLCFRLFTTPLELFDALEARYNLRPPASLELSGDELARWMERKVAPVRLRIFNFFKTWLETHWHTPTDHAILDRLVEFTRTSMTHSLQRPGQRLAELAQRRIIAGPCKKVMAQVTGAPVAGARGPGTLKRMVSTDRLKNGAMPPGMTDVSSMYSASAYGKKGPMPPAPIVSKALLSSLRAVPQPPLNVVDFDPTELARQLTIMESKIYCSILPEELLGQEFSKKAGVSSAVHVKSMSSLSTHITGWISECILGEGDARKRTQLVKFFIKLGDVSCARCSPDAAQLTSFPHSAASASTTSTRSWPSSVRSTRRRSRA